MNQSEISNRYTATKNELERIQEDDKQFLYATLTKYIPKHGHIHEMSMKTLLKAKKYLNEAVSNSYSKEMEELGINNEESGLRTNNKVQGLKVTVWENDMKTRIEEIRLQNRVANLENDLVILKNHLDADSARNIDLQRLSGVSLG